MTFYTSPSPRTSRAKRSGANTAPVNFNPAAHPILARHFFGIEPPLSTTVVTTDAVADLRFRRRVDRLHRLGPRATAELLAEIGGERGIQTIIDRKLDLYVDLDAEALASAGGDRFWPAPLREVKS